MIELMFMLLLTPLQQDPQASWKPWADSVNAWAESVKAWMRTTDERLGNYKSQLDDQRAKQVELLKVIEALKATPAVVESKTTEIKDQQAQLQATVDEVKAKQEEPPPSSLTQTLSQLGVALGGFLSAVAVTFVLRLQNQLKNKIVLHEPDDDKPVLVEKKDGEVRVTSIPSP